MEPTAGDPSLRASVGRRRVARFGGDPFLGLRFGRLVLS